MKHKGRLILEGVESKIVVSRDEYYKLLDFYEKLSNNMSYVFHGINRAEIVLGDTSSAEDLLVSKIAKLEKEMFTRYKTIKQLKSRTLWERITRKYE